MGNLLRRQLTRALRSIDVERAKQQKVRDGIHAVLDRERRQVKLSGGFWVGFNRAWANCVQLKFWHPSGITALDVQLVLDTVHGWEVVKTCHPYSKRVGNIHSLNEKQAVVTLRRLNVPF